jgi:hypothetical protein
MTGTGKEVTVETLQRLVNAFNAHDLDAVMSFFTDDPLLELPRGPDPGPEVSGARGGRRRAGQPVRRPPRRPLGQDRPWVSGDRGCSEWLLTGTTTQDDRVEVQGCDLFEFQGDKIARKDSHWKIMER